MTRFALRLFVLALVGALAAPLAAQEAATETLSNRPKVPGLMRLNLRERKETAPGSKEFKIVERTVVWEVAKTAIIVIDMWDARTKKAVFRGAASKTLAEDPSKALKQIDAMIEKIALKFQKMRKKEEK